MASAVSTFTGAAKCLGQLAKLTKFVPQVFDKAFYQEMQVELTEIKRSTPVKTGALRASETITEPMRSGSSVAITVSAGGPSVDYAWAVHEDLEAFHKTGEAKYIERPLTESLPYLPDRIAKRIDLNEGL